MPQIKYRAACDHCSATKIKCTQERPSCARCRTLGRDCNYSRSLRAGKPPRSSQGLAKKFANAPAVARQRMPPQPLPPLPKTEYSWTSYVAPYPTPPPQSSTPGDDMFSFSELPAWTKDAGSPSTSSMNTDWFLDFDNNTNSSFGSIPTSSTHSEIYDPLLDPQPLNEFQTPTGLPSFENILNSPCALSPSLDRPTVDRCTRLAMDTLNNLYELPRNNIGTRHPSLDQALPTAARAVHITHDLITCPCPKDVYLPMLIATIVSKTIAWYQAISLVHDPSTAKGCVKEVVGLETYPFDEKFGSPTLRDQVVLGQLRRLEEVVGAFEVMFCGGGGLEAVQMYSAMAGFLKGRLGFTIGEVEGRLKRGEY